MRKKQFDEVVDWLPGLHHEHDLAGSRQGLHELRHRLRADKVLALRPLLHELLCALCRAVVDGHGKALAFHVEGEILPHDGQSDESEILGHDRLPK
jgi:hypothetical protein